MDSLRTPLTCVPLFCLLAAACVVPNAAPDWEAVRLELARRVAEEQDLRSNRPSGSPDHAWLERLEAVDADNRAWLRALVDAHGWLTISRVGNEGAGDAWLLAQHADPDVDFQERCLEWMRAAVAIGEATPTNLAYLEDRVAVNRGRPQIYGTQFHEVDGEMVPRLLADPERVDERRASVGLGPLEEYARLIRELSRK